MRNSVQDQNRAESSIPTRGGDPAAPLRTTPFRPPRDPPVRHKGSSQYSKHTIAIHLFTFMRTIHFYGRFCKDRYGGMPQSNTGNILRSGYLVNQSILSSREYRTASHMICRLSRLETAAQVHR